MKCVEYTGGKKENLYRSYLRTFGDFSTSTKHILQLPATDNLSW